MKAATEHAYPGPGRTMTSLVRPWLLAYRSNVALVEDELDSRVASRVAAQLGCPGAAGTTAHATTFGDSHRAARFVCAAWLAGLATGALDIDSGLGAAGRWFFGHDLGIADDLSAEPLRTLMRSRETSSIHRLFPYLLDIHGEGTRRDVIRDASTSQQRIMRKDAGAFYTPSDVAEYMVARALAGTATPAPVLDPACGTGVFLAAALEEFVGRGVSVAEAIHLLYGIDISLEAVEAAALTIWLRSIELGAPADRPLASWHDCRRRLLATDTLKVSISGADGTLALAQVWPVAADGFRTVVGNPPYSKIGDRSDAAALARDYLSLSDMSPSTNLYLPFVEQAWRLGRGDGVLALVVPLSLGASSNRRIRRLREWMRGQEARWSFAFFDRTPDALFGDDVKQRNAIVVAERGHSAEVLTTSLQRWTSRTRRRLFETIESQPLGKFDFADGVPRLGSAEEVAAYAHLRRIVRADGLSSSLKAPPAEGTSIWVAPTAYNWLTVTRTTADRDDQADASTHAMIRLSAADRETASVVFALLNSRLAFWWWRVTGDGFHVTRMFLDSLPVELDQLSAPARQSLAKLGEQLANASLTSSASRNRGRVTVTRCPWSRPDLIDSIDRALVELLGLPADFVSYLRHYVADNALVDQADENRIGTGSRVLRAWT